MNTQHKNEPTMVVSGSKHEIMSFKLPIRYSLLAKKLVIKGENRQEMLDLIARLLIGNDPQTEVENILCEKIISSSWKLQRAGVIERNILNQENEIAKKTGYEFDDFGVGDEDQRKRVRNIKKVRLSSPEVQYIIQYQFELEKGLQKALRRLKEEQTSRGTTKND